MKKLLLASVLGVSLSSSFAANMTSSFQATSTLNATCTLAVSPMIFGEINFLVQDEYEATSSIEVLCTKGTAFYVETSSENELNEMTGSAENSDVLKYSLYTSQSYSKGWTNQGSGSSSTLEGTGTGQVESLPFYGLAEKTLNPSLLKPDSYSGTITAKITY